MTPDSPVWSPALSQGPRAAYSPASATTKLRVVTSRAATVPWADTLPLLPPPLSQGEGQEGRDPSRHQVTEWPVACDLGAADWGEALNGHRGCGLGPGHAPAPVVSQGGTSAHLLAGQAPRGVGELMGRRPGLRKGGSLVYGEPESTGATSGGGGHPEGRLRGGLGSPQGSQSS